MEGNTQVVRYVPGQFIDTRCALEIVGPMDSELWTPIETAYPEIKTAGPKAPFRSAPTVVIWPPTYMSLRMLGRLLGLGDDRHWVCLHPSRTKLEAVLVHVQASGSYASIHIYRYGPPRDRRG